MICRHLLKPPDNPAIAPLHSDEHPMSKTPGTAVLTTRLVIDRALGEVIERERYTRVRYPHNPTFYAGNYLLYHHAPTAADAPLWLDDHAREFGDHPEVQHVTLEWDEPSGELGECGVFVRQGFELECCFGMTTREAPPALAPPEGVTLRHLDPDAQADWDALEAMLRGMFKDDAKRTGPFLHHRVADFRALTRLLHATWWGAFTDGGQLIGSLGVVPAARYGRYQEIIVDPSHRKRGVASALLHTSAREALARDDVDALVLEVATDNHDALPVYRRAGFQVVEYTAAVVRCAT